jgi:hypothetical protein
MSRSANLGVSSTPVREINDDFRQSRPRGMDMGQGCGGHINSAQRQRIVLVKSGLADF